MKNRATKCSVLLSLLVFSLSCGNRIKPQDATSIEFLSAPGAETLSLPFSEAVRVGDMLYLSGQLGIVPGTSELVPGGIGEETRQAIENIKAILERNGSTLDRVVKCTVFLADINEWPNMNEVYRTYFPKAPPARSAVAASGLALNARVEIECIAVVGQEQHQ
jgi:reactive intermediate/imine deaminase